MPTPPHEKRIDAPPWTQTGQRIREARLRLNLSQETLAEKIGASVRSISRWERGEVLPYPHMREQLCRLFQMDTHLLFGIGNGEPILPPENPPLWMVPLRRNPLFTGREAILRQLHERLESQHTAALNQTPAISGLGGIGKTQVALEYAYQYRQEYHWVFWMHAATQNTLLADLVTLAQLLHISEHPEQDHQKALQAMTHWFSSHQHWLLILDNADDLTVVRDVLSLPYGGHVLLTTRAQALGTLAQRIDVDTMGVTTFFPRKIPAKTCHRENEHESVPLSVVTKPALFHEGVEGEMIGIETSPSKTSRRWALQTG